MQSSGIESNLYIAAVFSYYLISFEVNNNYIQKVDAVCVSLKLEHIRSVSNLEAVCGSCLLGTDYTLLTRWWKWELIIVHSKFNTFQIYFLLEKYAQIQ